MDKRAVRFPEGFEPDLDLREYARSFRLEPYSTFEHFKDHHLSKGSRFVDWRAAFRTWCRRAGGFERAWRNPIVAEVENPPTSYCATCGHTGSWHLNEVKHGRAPGHEFTEAMAS